MIVSHNLKNIKIRRNADNDAGFLITNKNGSYAYLKSTQTSRYQGIFFYDNSENRMFKVIETIEINGHNNNEINKNEIAELKNNFYCFERKRLDLAENFLMPHGFNSLIYRLNKKRHVDLILDCKESFDNRQFGRYYDITIEKDMLLVKFTKRTDKKEDSTDGMEEYFIYLAAKCDGGYQNTSQWFERFYEEDKNRNSLPHSRFVFNALKLDGQNFIFSFGKDKENVIKECSYLHTHISTAEQKEKQYFYGILKNASIKKIMKNKQASKDIKLAYICSLNSLNSLVVEKSHNAPGLMAGLPWFFQFWSRDALVSSRALSSIDKNLFQKLLFFYLNKIQEDGRISNIADDNSKTNSDSIGWLIKRLEQYSNKNIIKNKLIIALSKIQKNNLHQLLYCNGPDETWMDSISNRVYVIETQAMLLNFYKFLYNTTADKKYKILENITRQKVREKFWNGNVLADVADDFTVRPNIFIAAYIYPELLSKEEWEKCFETALNKLWLDWGGVSSVDKTHHLFTPENTGENPKSYHNGDSWFWINNLSALVLYNTDKNKFKKYIKKIIEASTHDILWHGAVGCHSEISDAKQLTGRGCISQAWSSAMYAEMIEEMFL